MSEDWKYSIREASWHLWYTFGMGKNGVTRSTVTGSMLRSATMLRANGDGRSFCSLLRDVFWGRWCCLCEWHCSLYLEVSFSE